jgi:hypothetical protein
MEVQSPALWLIEEHSRCHAMMKVHVRLHAFDWLLQSMQAREKNFGGNSFQILHSGGITDQRR